MPRLCEVCGNPIPEARLEALPDAVRCVQCVKASGDVQRVRGRNVYDHKTAGSIEVLTPSAFREANRVDPRGTVPSIRERAVEGDGDERPRRRGDDDDGRLPNNADCAAIIREMETVRGRELDDFERSFLRSNAERTVFSDAQKISCRRMAKKFDLRAWSP